eukprot:jgi/Hompol1/218/HPOL_002459-RA
MQPIVLWLIPLLNLFLQALSRHRSFSEQVVTGKFTQSQTSIKSKKKTPPKNSEENIAKKKAANRKPIDFAHMASASLGEINRLVQIIDEQKAYISRLIEEQRTLKIINSRQERAIIRSDKEQGDLPIVIRSMNEELRVSRVEKQKHQERIMMLEKTSQSQTDEIYRLNEKITSLNLKLKSSETADVIELRHQIDRQRTTIEESTSIINQMERQIRQLESERDREIAFAKTRSGKLLHELDLAKSEIEILKQQLKIKDRHINAMSIYTAPHSVRHDATTDDGHHGTSSMSSSRTGHTSSTMYKQQRHKAGKQAPTQPYSATMSPIPSSDVEDLESAPIVTVSFARDGVAQESPQPTLPSDNPLLSYPSTFQSEVNSAVPVSNSTSVVHQYIAGSGARSPPAMSVADTSTLKSTIHKPAMFISKPAAFNTSSPQKPEIGGSIQQQRVEGASPMPIATKAASATGEYDYDVESLLAQRVEDTLDRQAGHYGVSKKQQMDTSQTVRTTTTASNYSDDFS